MATKRRLTFVLALLIAVSVYSWWLGIGNSSVSLPPSFVISAVVIFIALLKVRIIFAEFLEVGIAPTWVRRSCDSWLIVVYAALFVVYFSLQP